MEVPYLGLDCACLARLLEYSSPPETFIFFAPARSALCLLLLVFCLCFSVRDETAAVAAEFRRLCSGDLEMGVVLLLWQCPDVCVNTPTTHPFVWLRGVAGSGAKVTVALGAGSTGWTLLRG